MDVQILGISANDTFSQKTFAESLQLPYPLLSDFPDLQVIRTYAGVQPDTKNPQRLVARRSFFLVDKQGILRGKWFVKNAEVFPSEPMLHVVQTLNAR